ncbi:MAG: hypothetical protein K1V96_11255 [Lachnospiraceae bacterium]
MAKKDEKVTPVKTSTKTTAKEDVVVKSKDETKKAVADVSVEEVEKAKETVEKTTEESQQDEAKKEASAKKTTKKAPAKKAEVKKEVEKVEEIYLQFHGQEIFTKEILDKAKQAYVAEGHRESSIKSIRLYIKPEENMAYYVINEKIAGGVAL